MLPAHFVRAMSWRESDLDVFFALSQVMRLCVRKPKPLRQAGSLLQWNEHLVSPRIACSDEKHSWEFHYVEDILAQIGFARRRCKEYVYRSNVNAS